VKNQRGEKYRIRLERKVESLGLAENVLFHNRFVDLETLISYLAATDIYLTPFCLFSFPCMVDDITNPVSALIEDFH